MTSPIVDPSVAPPADDALRAAPRRGRRRWLPLAGVLLVAGVVSGVLLLRDDGQRPSRGPSFAGPTATVSRGAVDDAVHVKGRLRSAGRRTIVAGAAGTVTAVSGRGWIEFGSSLGAIDGQPVMLLPGTTPAWRAFAPKMTGGVDVLQLEQALASMGYLREPVNRWFRAGTTAAIKRWQSALGLPPTGTLAKGTVVFSPTRVRVVRARVRKGAVVADGASLVDVATGGKSVVVDLPQEKRQNAVRGQAASVTLPNGSTTRGRVVSVGSPRLPAAAANGAADDDGGSEGGDAPTSSEPVVPVGIRLLRPAAARAFEQGEVDVELRKRVRRRALTVPISALVALDARRFGLEAVQPDGAVRRVPVHVGAFVGSRVVVSGGDVRPGLRVAVADS